MNIVPFVNVAIASNGFLVTLRRPQGEGCVISLTKEHALALIAAEIDRQTLHPTFTPDNYLESQVNVVAQVLKVEPDDVRSAMRGQMGLEDWMATQ